jgi:hypothetical protein
LCSRIFESWSSFVSCKNKNNERQIKIKKERGSCCEEEEGDRDREDDLGEDLILVSKREIKGKKDGCNGSDVGWKTRCGFEL